MGLTAFIRAFRKVNRILDFRFFKSNLFHFNIVDGKNEYFNILVILYTAATSSNERVLYIYDCLLE